MMDYGLPTTKLNTILSLESAARHARQQARRHGEFLRGPIPLSWLAQTYRLGKPAMGVAILLWFKAGCCRRMVELSVSERAYKDFGLRRETFTDGLRKLESAGLVTVERRRGCKPKAAIALHSPEIGSLVDP